MAKFTDYTEKTEPVDTDLALIYDTPAKVNKKFTFGNLWKWIAKKIVSEGISQLETTNKTIPGAINELNSKKAFINYFATNENLNNTALKNGIYVYNGYSNYMGTKPFSEAWGIYFIGNWTTEILHFCINAKTNVCYHRSYTSDKWSAWL